MCGLYWKKVLYLKNEVRGKYMNLIILIIGAVL